MNTPLHVAVTGAAGQIGYSLLFRIASGAMFGPGPTGRPAPDRNPARPARARRRGDGTRRLRVSAPARDRPHRRPGRRFPRRELGAARRQRAAQGRAWSARTCSASTARFSPARARPSPRTPRPDVRVARGRQSLQHQLPHRHEQRAGNPGRPLVRHDPPRRKPRQGPTRAKGRRRRQGRHQPRHLGQPFRHAVPGFLQRQDQRPARRRRSSTDHAWLEGPFISTVQQRGAAIIKARGQSSAASAANAVVDTVRSLVTPTAGGRLEQRGGLLDRRAIRRGGGADHLVPDPHRRTAKVGKSCPACRSTISAARGSTPATPS